MTGLDAWWDSGSRTALRVGSGEHRLFHRIQGDGPWTTFLHGFPTSSYDWQKVASRMPPGRRRLFVDHLGFGASEKPRPHRYSFDEQIDLLQALWRHHDVAATDLVAHDYSVSIAQEILARINRLQWDGPHIRSFVLLNGGLFYSFQDPLPVQRILRTPLLGDLAVKGMHEGTFRRSMGRILKRPVPDEELHDHWRAIEQDGGRHAIPALSRYHAERKRNEPRWAHALNYASIPLRLLWGLADPVSGTRMLDGLTWYDNKTARVIGWGDVGHYPQLEAPDQVAWRIAEVEKATTPG